MCSQDGLLNAPLGAAADLSLEPASETTIPEPVTSPDTPHSPHLGLRVVPTGEGARMPLFVITFVFTPRRTAALPIAMFTCVHASVFQDACISAVFCS